MIQLYKAENKSFECNGDMTLIPSKATVHVVMNGAWETEIEHPIDKEERWRYIKENAVVKMPSFNGEQLFRIKKKRKSDSGVTATLEPIFFDAKDDCFLTDIRPTEKNGQQALDIMTSPNNKYTGKSNITILSTAYYEYMNLIEAINGNQDNSFVNRWGGEILFDNFTVVINDRIGIDNGVELRYGKNIPVDGLSEEIDVNAVATRIYPKAFNGHKLSGTGYIDSDLIEKYPVVKSVTMSFEDVKMICDIQGENDTEGIIICNNQEELDDALIKKCKEQFDSGLDKPVITIEADMILLKNTEQYKDYAILEDVSLGDTIHCRNSNLEIVTDARVIELEYDSIRQKVTSVVLGSFQYNYFNDVSSMINRVEGAIRGDGTVVATQVQGILDAVKTQMRAQSTIAKKQNVRAMLFEDLDPDSETFGAMCLGTMGFQIAGERTADGRDWNWTTFGTGKGFFADYIVAGTMLADRIYGGTLTLGGYNNQNGKMAIQDAEGNEIGRWDNNGIRSTGHYVSHDPKSKKQVDVYRGRIVFSNTYGHYASIEEGGDVQTPAVRLSATKDGVTDQFIEVSGEEIRGQHEDIAFMAEDRMAILAKEMYVGPPERAYLTKSGKAEFSDGSYLEFKNGVLIGGKTASGSTF